MALNRRSEAPAKLRSAGDSLRGLHRAGSAATSEPLSPPPRLRWPGWRHLPREARDTLFLLAVIGWTALPHLAHLPLWCALLTATVLLWRGSLALTQAPLPGRWARIAVLALAAGLTLWSFRTLLGKDAGVTMAVALMGLKTLELRARRDAFVVFFLGFFLVLTQFLYAQTLAVALMTFVAVWGLLTALVLAHMPVGRPPLRQAAALAARTALLGAPLMALLFVLFPRIGPLWGLPQDGVASTGLSNSLRMGSVAEVAQDDAVALRLRFDGPAPPPESLYFRGPVLSNFDGQTWTPLQPRFPREVRPQAELRVAGPAIGYEMTIEPLRLATLPLLEATTTAPPLDGYRVSPRADLQWVADRPVLERVRFHAQAQLQFRHGPTQPVPGLQDYLELPPGANPRTLGWAAALRREPRYAGAEPRVLADALLQHIRRGGFTYTLAPGEYAGRDAIDAFWLDRREGFCEHFAAAFVVVMRAMGVPARIVTGYQGADPLPIDGYYVVRQSSAHAWAEYWQAGIGWIRADPTGAVAPDRITGSRRLAPPPGLVAGALGTVSPALLAQWREGWELLNNRWNQWVLNYSRVQQLDALRALGVESPDWQDLALLLIGTLSAIALAGAGWAAWERSRIDPWTRQWQRLHAALAAAGVPAAAHEPPRRLAARVRRQLGDAGAALADALDTLDRARYGRDAAARPPLRLAREAVRAARALPARPTG